MKNITALVPMKEHSERVPGKNFRLFNGKPLFYWVLRELTKAEQVNGIFVDTDSPKLAESILGYFPREVQIIARPVELCGDDVSMNLIINHDIGVTGAEYILQTHTTNPLLSNKTIAKAVDMYFSNIGSFDSVFSVTRVQSRCYTHDGVGINHNPNELLPTQQLRPVYIENSNFYIFSRDSFRQAHKRIGRKPLMFEMNQ